MSGGVKMFLEVPEPDTLLAQAGKFAGPAKGARVSRPRARPATTGNYAGVGEHLYGAPALADWREGHEGPPLRREVHAAQEVLKARVGAQRIVVAVNV